LGSCAPVGLPVLFRLFRPKDDRYPDLDRPSQPELARGLIDMVLERFPAAIVELIMDGAYVTAAVQNAAMSDPSGWPS
jgi:hypothetical protein